MDCPLKVTFVVKYVSGNKSVLETEGVKCSLVPTGHG